MVINLFYLLRLKKKKRLNYFKIKMSLKSFIYENNVNKIVNFCININQNNQILDL
jgi:hypothetical protein